MKASFTLLLDFQYSSCIRCLSSRLHFTLHFRGHWQSKSMNLCSRISLPDLDVYASPCTLFCFDIFLFHFSGAALLRPLLLSETSGSTGERIGDEVLPSAILITGELGVW